MKLKIVARVIGSVFGWFALSWFIASMVYEPPKFGYSESWMFGFVFSTLIIGFIFAATYWDHHS